MNAKPIQIVDLGRGPQIEGHRVTVMDVFYYLHRGYDFDFIHRAMPSMTRAQFDAVVEYVRLHDDQLAEKDRRVEEFRQRGMEAQRSRGGIFAARVRRPACPYSLCPCRSACTTVHLFWNESSKNSSSTCSTPRTSAVRGDFIFHEHGVSARAPQATHARPIPVNRENGQA